MKKNSNNYKKQKQKVAALNAKIKRQRSDFLHKLSCNLVKTYDVIGIEDLNMSAIKQSLKFGKSVSDIGWGEFARMLDYKGRREGCTVVKISKWFPSSKKCLKCGHIHSTLQLSDRLYICPVCNHMMDRDHQAAKNIDAEAMKIFYKEIAA